MGLFGAADNVESSVIFGYGNARVHLRSGEAKVTSRQIAQKAPYPVDVEVGTTYWWCACGQS